MARLKDFANYVLIVNLVPEEKKGSDEITNFSI
jgi:hypothetical protein